MFTRKVFSYYLALLFTLFCITLNVNSQVYKLSKPSKISLLTCSSGDELYSVFGHSALRVYDDSLGIDVVFNYGTFDFNTPNFYLKFMNGDLDYMLAYSSYDHFYRSYERDNREVVESVLDLSQVQKQQLWDYLLWNVQPANRYYRYDFFFDNCATRLRDIVFKAKGLKYDEKINSDNTSNLTFRDYIHYYVPESSWTAEGIDMLLGIKADNEANVYDRAFLPACLDSLFVNTNIVSKRDVVLEREFTTNNDCKFTLSPDATGWLVFTIAVCLLVVEIRKRVYIRWYDIILFTVCSLLSILFWYLWLFTKHSVCSWNINVMWASILYIPIVISLIRNKTAKLDKWLIEINLLFLASYFMLSILGFQDIPSMTIPVALALAIRNIQLFRKIVANED